MLTPSRHGGSPARLSSPPSARSTLITSPPGSPSSIAASGPASTREKSATRRPSSTTGQTNGPREDDRRLRPAPRQVRTPRPGPSRRPARAADGGRGRGGPARRVGGRARAAGGAAPRGGG